MLHDAQRSLHRYGVWESSAPHQSQDQSSERGPVSPLLQRWVHLPQSVFGPRGPRCCLPSVCGHQAHFQAGSLFFAPFFLAPRAGIVIYMY